MIREWSEYQTDWEERFCRPRKVDCLCFRMVTEQIIFRGPIRESYTNLCLLCSLRYFLFCVLNVVSLLVADSRISLIYQWWTKVTQRYHSESYPTQLSNVWIVLALSPMPGSQPYEFYMSLCTIWCVCHVYIKLLYILLFCLRSFLFSMA